MRTDRERAAKDLAALCANVPGQWAVQTALGGVQSIYDLTAPSRRLGRQRKALIDGVASSPFLSVPTPMGAFYAFVGVKPERCRELALAVSAVILGNVQLHLEDYSPVSTFDEAPALAEHGIRLLITGFRSART